MVTEDIPQCDISSFLFRLLKNHTVTGYMSAKYGQ